jgi:hypothetical protein
MSRKQHPFPWRVIALSVVLFAALAAVAWLILGPRPPADTTTGTPPPAAGDTPTAQAESTVPGTPAEVAQQPDAGEIDPTTPEGRAALAAQRAAAGTMDLQLFLIVPGIERLIPVARTVASPPTLDAQVKRAVEELINWSGSETISPLAPETRLRETWVSPGGIAYLDFGRSFYDFSGGGSLGELHTVYGIVATVTVSFPEIVAVQFLLEGKELDTLAGHVDLSRPLLPSDEWVLIEQDERQIPPSDGSS